MSLPAAHRPVPPWVTPSFEVERLESEGQSGDGEPDFGGNGNFTVHKSCALCSEI